MSTSTAKKMHREAPPTWAVIGYAVALVVGIATSVYLSWVHLQVKYAETVVGGLCNLSSKVNCNVAAGSAYSEVGGVPIAVLGGAFYLAALVALLLWRGRKYDDPWYPRMAILFFSLSVLYSLFLGAIAAFVLGSFCWACTLLYVVNVAGLIFGRSLGAEGYLTALKKLAGDPAGPVGGGTTITLVLTFVVVVSAGTLATKQIGARLEKEARATTKQSARSFVGEYEKMTPMSQKQWDELISAGYVKGPATATVTLVEFSDFQCPFCARNAPEIDKLAETYPNDVRVVFLHYPLDTSCNPHLSRNMHPAACAAAAVAECADRQDLFWPVHDALFQQHHALGPTTMREIVTEAGGDPAALDNCVPEALSTVKEHLTLGRELGVRGTPAVFVNRKKVGGARSFEFLQQLVEHEKSR